MKGFRRFYCRLFQGCMRIAIPFMPYRKPKMLESVDKIPQLLSNKRVDSVLLVTDKSIRALGLTKTLEKKIIKEGIALNIFEDVVPNPTVENVENGLKTYLQNNCSAIVAFGGGSVMDCAKMIGARVARPNKSVEKMKGLLKVGKKLPVLVAVPTTAGTGSETTITAVITNQDTHYKYTVNDFSLIPTHAVLDYKVTVGLPAHITSTTGMDALTHAVEAYIGKSTTKDTRKYAEDAVVLIVDNIKKVYDAPTDKEARKNMLIASFYAGLAFRKSYVGYVHAIAHSLGGKYGVPHGLANAVILPHMLEEYGEKCYVALSKLAKVAKLARPEDSDEAASKKFIQWIKETNKYMSIPSTIDKIELKDIVDMATNADKEANPLYPVPKLMDREDLMLMYKKIGGIE